jgi:tRNA threonylcarbamoyladenosine biosynthesis protein TsaB
MKILAVDTALGACSAALVDGARIVARRFEAMERGHAERLAPMVDEVMREAGTGFAALDRLAVTTGPGTFTGQRIGLAFMRGLRVALKRPLVGVTSLAAMAEQARAETGRQRALAVHDARRDEFYIELDASPVLMTREAAREAIGNFAAAGPVALAGTAAPLFVELLASDKLILSSVRQPDAVWVAHLAAAMAEPEGAPRPLYLRAPDARLPKAAP